MVTARQKEVLKAIIENYVLNKRAVGSKYLQNNLESAVSSATIRNEMMSLEKQGLLKKEHASSGRIPSTLGYRFYLDHLFDLLDVDVDVNNDLEFLKNLSGYYQQIDDILNKATDVLANKTNFTVVAILPKVTDLKLADFKIINLGVNKMVALLATSDGNTVSQTFYLPSDVSVSTLDELLDFVENQLIGLPIDTILDQIHTDVPLTNVRTINNVSNFIQLLGDLLAKANVDRVYTGGKLNLLDYLNDIDLKDIKKLYQTLDDPNKMRNLLIKKNNLPINVQIAEEIPNKLFNEFSMISTEFEANANRAKGKLVILGPVAMDYRTTIKDLILTSNALSKKIIEFN